MHYSDVRMGTTAAQITSLTIVYSAIYLGADPRKQQSSAPLAFVRENHRWEVNSPHKWPITRKMFPFDDVIMARHSQKLAYTQQTTFVDSFTETEMSSFLWNYHHWLHWKLSKWQLPVQPVMKISSNDDIFVSVLLLTLPFYCFTSLCLHNPK